MATRQIVRIDEEKCDGCGECIPSCAEGAIQLIDGKARLVAENLCDGLGACLGECPQGAITVEERMADEYDEAAVAEHLQTLGPEAAAARRAHEESRAAGNGGHGPAHDAAPPPFAATACNSSAGGCPGSQALQIEPLGGAPAPSATGTSASGTSASGASACGCDAVAATPSSLRQWPVQLHLVSPEAPYFQGADVLLAADCTAYALGDFHTNHLAGKALAVACPKLDTGQEAYLQKLVAMIDESRIDTLTVLVMEVPCCTGLVRLARLAAEQAQRKVPIKQVVVGRNGAILGEEWL